MVGVLVAAVLAAAMSTLSSSLNSSANAFVTDFYRPLRPHHPESVVRAAVAGDDGGVGRGPDGRGVRGVPARRADKSVVEQVLAVAGFTTGLLLGLFVLGSLRRPVRSGAALAGMVCGFVAVLAVWLPSLPVFDGKPILAWPWFAPLGAGTTVVVALLADRVGRASVG